MCQDCSSWFDEKSKLFGFSEVKKIDFVKIDDEDDVGLICSCCGVDFNRKKLVLDQIRSDNFGRRHEVQKQGKETEETIETIASKNHDSNSEKPTQDLEFLLDYSGNQLVPIESIDPKFESVDNSLEVDEDQEFGDFQKANVMTQSSIETVTEEVLTENQETHFVLQDAAIELVSVIDKTEHSSKFAELDLMEFEETDHSLVFHVNSNGFHDQNTSISEPTQTSSNDKEHQETEEGNSENDEAEVSIGTEIPVLDSCDEMKAQDHFNLYSLSREEPSTSSNDLDFNLEYGLEEVQEDEKTEELNLNQLEDTMFMIERKGEMVDESLDGGEMDGGDSSNTVEKLKSALRVERKALQALYTELEEERSASAVAASETMAMINRLQEEKAAMQMEALHYQRMMEEQSEYDQEALQLLNELMVKKEKELELYRKRVLDYETKERMRFSTSSVKSGACSASCSHSEDGDGGWIDLNNEPKEERIANGNQENDNHNISVDTMLNLHSSFIDFEDERLSILEQLKILEEKLVTLSDEEDQHFGDLKEDYFEENGKHLNGEYTYNGQEVNGITNGFPNESHEIHYQDRRSIGSTGKRPFTGFNTLETASDDDLITSNGHGNGFHAEKVENAAVTLFELQKKRIDIEEEVDQLYIFKKKVLPMGL
ncbi:hypothetical protein QVD17_31834 [Tagetes erecta]|uniref:GTD-binding domain-containing protein n=1 Tax=Tagetes erecta TaxID=13708 RepID=A0AAD8K6Y9_TARER|nr:hypothetical protein QVD17_31834 [Tagetes erecta]